MRQELLKVYDKDSKQLLFFKKEKNEQYWDNIWLKYWFNNRNHIITFPNSLVCRITERFLKPENGFILEGGYGLGFKVFSNILLLLHLIVL